ncbi:MAG: hypothetical protein AAGE61_16150 [Pseudomonadota bacterium]
MTFSKLPNRPDLQAIKDVARETSQRRNLILGLIGNLSFCWSNNESMLIYLIMALLRTNETSAKIIFGTLNTTRARMDLVERLAAAHLTDETIKREIKRILRVFNDCTKVRNELIHCMFHIDQGGDITHTHSLRVQVQKGELQTVVTQDMDDARIRKMASTVKKLVKLNADLWAFLPVLDKHMRDLSHT